MERPLKIFDSAQSLNPSLQVQVDGVPIRFLANGLLTNRSMKVQKRCDDLSGSAVWADYFPYGGAVLALTATKNQIILGRPGQYRLSPVNVVGGDNVTVVLIKDNNVNSNGSPVIQVPVAVN